MLPGLLFDRRQLLMQNDEWDIGEVRTTYDGQPLDAHGSLTTGLFGSLPARMAPHPISAEKCQLSSGFRMATTMLDIGGFTAITRLRVLLSMAYV
jgi:hypothetical protein